MPDQPLIPPFGKNVRLKNYDPGYTGKFRGEGEAMERVLKDLDKLDDLQERLYAEGKHALLIIFQAMDTGGKDGAIRHVFRGCDPQGVRVTSFKAPTPAELARDFLWRVHQNTPPKGMIGIFNRSHYEDVLIVRVHNLAPKKVWKERYDHINAFEELLIENGATILKFFLYISKDEQKERLQARLDDPNKQWKFALGDLKERERWNEYIEAYEDMLTRCNTERAPWYIVPSNHKWYRNYVVAKIVVETLEKLDPQFPKPEEDLSGVVIPD
jgi:PPK2 family polyphosphate:nucleotide phosphotransferase